MKVIKSPIKTKDPSIQKIIDDIYRNLTELSNAVNDVSGKGESHNLIVTKVGDGSYKLKVRHKDGFVEVDATLSTGV